MRAHFGLYLVLKFDIDFQDWSDSTDTGSGISDAKLETIFREFEQVSTVGDQTQSFEEGHKPAVGLGLAVVARIVRNLGGQLRVESKEGQGSKFTFILPFVLPSVDPEPRNDVDAEGKKMFVAGTESSSRTISAHGFSNPSIVGTKPRQNSGGSTHSDRSRSDIASLISAMSSSHMDANVNGKASARHHNHFPNNAVRSSNPSISVGSRSQRSTGEKSLDGEVELGDNNVSIRPIKMDPLAPGPSSRRPSTASYKGVPVSPSRVRSNGQSDTARPTPVSIPSPLLTPSTLLGRRPSTPAPATSSPLLLPNAMVDTLPRTPSPVDDFLGVLDSAQVRHVSEFRRSSTAGDNGLVPLQPMRVLVVEVSCLCSVLVPRNVTDLMTMR